MQSSGFKIFECNGIRMNNGGEDTNLCAKFKAL